jgi:hypothetical protein
MYVVSACRRIGVSAYRQCGYIGVWVCGRLGVGGLSNLVLRSGAWQRT